MKAVRPGTDATDTVPLWASTIDRTIGDIGLSVFEKLNKEIGKGGDLAGKLQAYLASPAGKEMIDKTASVMAKLVDATRSRKDDFVRSADAVEARLKEVDRKSVV